MTEVFLGGAFGFGLIFGSFLNVLISRFPHEMAAPISRGNSVFWGRSYCDSCKKNLRWFELIPLISFIALRGKCARCKQPILARYSIVELLTGGAFAALAFALLFFPTINGIPSGSLSSPALVAHVGALFAGLCALLSIFLFDLEYSYIPDISTGILAGAGLVESFLKIFVIGNEAVFLVAASAVGAGVFFFLLWYMTGGTGMGFGDVKLAFVLPLFLGSGEGVAALFVAFWIGAAVSLALVAWKRKKMKDEIPFGPFLVLGALIILVFPHIVPFLFHLRGSTLSEL